MYQLGFGRKFKNILVEIIQMFAQFVLISYITSIKHSSNRLSSLFWTCFTLVRWLELLLFRRKCAKKSKNSFLSRPVCSIPFVLFLCMIFTSTLNCSNWERRLCLMHLNRAASKQAHHERNSIISSPSSKQSPSLLICQSRQQITSKPTNKQLQKSEYSCLI